MNLSASDLGLDDLQLYFGAGYKINDHLIVRQPKVGDIVDLGENNYFMGLNTIIQTTWEAKAPLWDAGYDWEKISDFEYFCMRANALEPNVAKIFFEGDIDFGKFEIKMVFDENDPDSYHLLLTQVLDDGYLLEIDEYIYAKIVCFLREIHGIAPPTIRYPQSLSVKKLQIELDKRDQRVKSRKREDSFLLTSIATLVASSEFKYDSESIKKIPLREFYMTLDRIVINRQSQALMNGMYANADFSKMKDFNKLVNWLRPAEKHSSDSKLSINKN